MIMALNNKKYLTIDDAHTYFLRKTRHNLNLEDLRQLEREGKITPLVYLDVNFITRKLPNGTLYVFDLIDNQHIKRIKGYFKPSNFILLDYYEPSEEDFTDAFRLTKKKEYLYLKDGTELFELVEEISDNSNNIGLTGYIFNNSIKDENGFYLCIDTIDLDNVLILRSELDKLIDSIPSSDKKRIKQLEQELKQVKTNQAPEGQGDTLLILGAVMDSIKEVAKLNYTQENLIDVILKKYGNTTGISESTLKKKFPEAKKYLKQRYKS